MEIVAVDIGGTHARFALAEVEGKTVVRLTHETVLKTADHASFQTAWQAFGAALGRPLPRAVGIAIAGPVDGEVIQFTNNPWIIRPSRIREKLDVDHYCLINDFAAVAYAVSVVPSARLRHICGPNVALPTEGVVSIIGPGTGLGAAILERSPKGDRVIATEGGHIDFAALDPIEDAVLARLRQRYRRVSVERIVSGPGLQELYGALSWIEGRAVEAMDDRELWALALSGQDSLAAAALDRFCLSLGSVAGDLALAHGAVATVLGGGVGLRLADHLSRSGFAQRFTAKGRFERRMAALPVKLIDHPQPGLLGAAAAFAAALD